MKFKIGLTLASIFWLFGAAPAVGQIVNDTTHLLYGPKTTQVFREASFFKGNYKEAHVDTTLNSNYSPYFWFSDTLFYQTLSNIGLPAKPLLFRFPDKIGARLGRDVFDLYAYHSENISYFNTRSPYSKLEFVQGSLGEGVFEGEFSRNIKKWWNAGLAYRRLATNKQLAGQRTDEEVVMNGLKLYTHLQTTNNRYHLFANYLNNNHKFVETGGVRPPSPDTPTKEFFDFLSEPVNLINATGREIRNGWHIGQTFALAGEHMKLFYDLDRRKQTNRFDNQNLADNRAFNRNIFNYDSSQTHDRSIYTELENTAGITGNQKHYFYRAYLKNRNVKVERLTPETWRINQTFVGGDAELKVNEKIKTSFTGEYKVADEYRAQADVQFLFLGFRQLRTSYAPSLMEQRYYGNHHAWNNAFDNISADQSTVWLQATVWHNFFRLEIASTSIRNYVYYNQVQNPAQAGSVQRLQTAVLNHKFNLGKLHWENLVAYTNNDKANLIRVPDFAVRSRIFYEGFIFKKALFGQVGIETNYKSGYHGDAYSPALQQFYLQDQFTVEDYPVIDVFIAADIKTINLFIKLAHANEGMFGPGYFTTPYYPGMRRSFIFGAKWQFFD